MEFAMPPNRSLRRGVCMRASIVAFSLLVAGSTFADDGAVRDKLTGKWQSDGNGDTWILKEAGDSIHVSNSSNAQIVAEFDCNTVGKECAVKRSGHKATVSMWFNGEKLVELETTGDRVVKRRFSVTGNGDTMDLEVIPITPIGPTAIMHFKRSSGDVSKP